MQRLPAAERAARMPAVLRPAARLSWLPQLLAAVIPAALLTAFALIPQPPYGAEPFHDAWRRHALVGLALLLWALALAVKRRLPRPNLLLLLLLLLTGVLAVSDIVNADWRIGVEPVLDLLAAAIVLAALVDMPGLSAASLRRSLMLAALALSLVALHFVGQRWLDWLALVRAVPGSGASLLPPTVPRVLGVGTNPNILAPLLTLSIPVFFFELLHDELLPGPAGRRGRRAERLAIALALAIVQVAVFFTLSRASWIGEAAGLVVVGILILLASRSSGLPIRLIIAAAGGVVLVAAAALGVILARGERPLWLFRPSFAARTDFRGAALMMIRQHPWLGAGPGRFPLLYPLISDGDPVGAVHSHNVPIQIAVDGGAIGLAAAVLVAASIIYLLWRAWTLGDRPHRRLVACVAGSFTSFAVGGMGDALHLFPEILFVLAALLAIVLRAGEQPDQVLPTAPRHRGVPSFMRAFMRGAPALSLLPLALGGLLLVGWLRIDEAEQHYARSISLSADQRWPAAAAEAGQASAIDPDLAVYHVQTALDLELEAESTGSADARRRAIGEFERALTIEPRSSSIRLDLAATLVNGGQSGEATALLPQIVAEAPRDPLTLMGAGVIGEASEPDRSVDWYADALAQNPRLADSPFWQGTALRRARLPEIVADAVGRAASEDSGAGPAEMERIILDGAAPALGRPGPAGGADFVARIDRAEALAVAGEKAQARQILLAAVRERPDDPSARLALGRLEESQGDLGEARGEWMAGAYLGDTASIMELGDTFPAGRVPPLVQSLARASLADLWLRQFTVTQQHYRFAFRRQEPFPIVLRGDWLNALPLVYSQLSAALGRWTTLTPALSLTRERTDGPHPFRARSGTRER